jgi:hypothetical protein
VACNPGRPHREATDGPGAAPAKDGKALAVVAADIVKASIAKASFEGR